MKYLITKSKNNGDYILTLNGRKVFSGSLSDCRAYIYFEEQKMFDV